MKYRSKVYLLNVRIQLFVSGSSQATDFWMPTGYSAEVYSARSSYSYTLSSAFAGGRKWEEDKGL